MLEEVSGIDLNTLKEIKDWILNWDVFKSIIYKIID